METKKDYVNRVFNEARALNLCRTQKEFAELLGMDKSTLSGALRGYDRFLTDSFVKRMQAWEKQVLDPKRGPRSSVQQERAAPQPDIIIPAATATLYNNMSETIRIQAELIARLQGSMVAGFAPAHLAPKNYRENE